MKKSLQVWSLSVVVVLAILLCIHFLTGNGERADNEPNHAGGVEHLKLPQPSVETEKIPSNYVPAASAASDPDLARQISKRDQIALLLKKNNPEDKFKAFKLAQECFASKEKFIKTSNRKEVGDGNALQLNKDAFREAELCGDLTNSEILQRILWLENAAEAGVTGAAQAYINVTADSESSPVNEQEKNEKISKYILAGAKAGDLYSMLVVSNQYELGLTRDRDPVLALAYFELAMEQAARLEKKVPDEARVLERLRSNLNKEQLLAVQTTKSSLTKGIK